MAHEHEREELILELLDALEQDQSQYEWDWNAYDIYPAGRLWIYPVTALGSVTQDDCKEGETGGDN